MLSPEEIQAKAKALPATELATLYTSHSEIDRERLYQEVAKGRSVTAAENKELSKQPEVKLSKANELLAKARARKQAPMTADQG